MATRGPTGASNRADLFQKTARSNEANRSSQNQQQINDCPDVDAIAEADERLHQDFGLGHPDDSPLQLEKVLGYSGDFRNTLKTLPCDETTFVRSLGCLVSFESLIDVNQQKCLRAHDMAISALDVSLSGRYVATGQIGTKNFKGYAAPVFIWHTATHKRIQVLKGLTERVNFVSFSPDERLICAGGEDSVLYIWDIATTEVLYCNRFPNPVSVFSWIQSDSGNKNVYEMAFGLATGLQRGVFSYDPTRVMWNLKISSYALTPGVNTSRTYTCIAITPDTSCVLVGTNVGEMLVFRRDTMIFRAAIPVCSNGLQSIVLTQDGFVICGGGDGSVKKLRGFDLAWNVINETQMESAVKSLALSPNQSEVIISCSSGAIVRCLVQSFIQSIIQLSHTTALTSISFNYDTNYPTNLFTTGSVNGEIRVWDIADYACQAILRLPKSGMVNCVKMIRNEFVISAWEDGFIRCHDALTLNRMVWSIANAHRGAVTSIDCYISDGLQYIVTGGEDSVVRIWKYNTRELITQCIEHKKKIQKVMIDVKQPTIIHSIAIDGSVLTYDLKSSRRIMYHMLPNGSLCDLTQRKDNELELITCDSYGRIVHWDIDYRDPVQNIQDPSRKSLRGCSISPSGRYLAIGGDDELVKVIDMEHHQIIALGQGHSDSITKVEWTADEQQLLTIGNDGCLCVWNFYLSGNTRK